MKRLHSQILIWSEVGSEAEGQITDSSVHICKSSAGGVDRIQGTTKEEHTKQAGGSYSASQREVLNETKE